MESLSLTSSSSSLSAVAAAGGETATSSREGSAKAAVVDHISQAIQSTSNLLHLMQQSSPSQDQLIKLPKNLLAKTSIINNTAQVLEQMPRVISTLDAHIENGLHSHIGGTLGGPSPDIIQGSFQCLSKASGFKGLSAVLEQSITSVPHLRTVIQLLSNIESSQLSSAVVPQTREEPEVAELHQTIS